MPLTTTFQGSSTNFGVDPSSEIFSTLVAVTVAVFVVVAAVAVVVVAADVATVGLGDCFFVFTRALLGHMAQSVTRPTKGSPVLDHDQHLFLPAH